jgi:hypothetical protein
MVLKKPKKIVFNEKRDSATFKSNKGVKRKQILTNEDAIRISS